MEIQSDPELNSIVVPKFILQPLVENSILHGLRARGDQVRLNLGGFGNGLAAVCRLFDQWV